MRYNENILPDASGKAILKTYHSAVEPCVRPFVPHHHTECELSLIMSGSGIYTVRDRKYSFKKGDVFLFDSDEIHCITEIYDGEAFDVLNLHFEPQIVWSDKGLSSTGLLKIFFSRSEAFENLIDRKNPSTPRIAELINKIEIEITEKEFEYKCAAMACLSEILVLLSRNYGYIKEGESENAGASAKLSEVMVYITENLSENITLSELAALCGMNKTYFCSVFKKYNGITPFDYITIKRIEKSVMLLKTTNRKMIDIASECGFTSMSNFYKAFRHITGKKPGEFRE